MGIELPIFHTTEESETLRKVGIDYDIKEKTIIQPITFYHINAISPYPDKGNDYCAIHSNGIEFICSLTYEEVKARLELI